MKNGAIGQYRVRRYPDAVRLRPETARRVILNQTNIIPMLISMVLNRTQCTAFGSA